MEVSKKNLENIARIHIRTQVDKAFKSIPTLYLNLGGFIKKVEDELSALGLKNGEIEKWIVKYLITFVETERAARRPPATRLSPEESEKLLRMKIVNSPLAPHLSKQILNLLDKNKIVSVKELSEQAGTLKELKGFGVLYSSQVQKALAAVGLR